MDAMLILYMRKKRREGILLTIISTIFIAAGAFIFCVVGNPWLAVVTVPFFGAMLLVGIFQTARPGQDLPPALAIIGCFGMGASGVLLILSDLLGINALAWRQGAALPVGIIVTVLFGGGGWGGFCSSFVRCAGVGRRDVSDLNLFC